MRSEEATGSAYTVERWKRSQFWALLDASGALVCVCACAYRRGALSLKEMLEGRAAA